jgi:hypothetical protein
VTARESDTGANDASRLRSGKARSHGAAITVDGTAARGSTLSRADAKASEDPGRALLPATYGLRIIPVGFAGKDRPAASIVPEGRVFGEKIREPHAFAFIQDAVSRGSFPRGRVA